MVTEDYVSFETAKLLKDKGFNEDSWFHYDNDGDIVTRGYRLNHPDDIPAWTHQMVMKWLRKTHKIFFNVNYYNLDIGNEWLQLSINRPNKIGCEASFEGFCLEEQRLD